VEEKRRTKTHTTGKGVKKKVDMGLDLFLLGGNAGPKWRKAAW